MEVQDDANRAIKGNPIKKAQKKKDTNILYGTIFYEIYFDPSDSCKRFPGILKEIEIVLDGDSNVYKFEMLDPNSAISKAAEQVFIAAAGSDGVYTNEDVYDIFRRSELTYSKDMSNQVRRRLNNSILLSIGSKAKGKQVFYRDATATKNKNKIMVQVFNKKKACAEDKQIANTVFVSKLKFKNSCEAPDEVIEYEKESNYDHRSMR